MWSPDSQSMECGVRVRSTHVLFELVQRAVARQYLRRARVGFAALADRGDELPVLQLDAVHRNVDLRDVDFVVLAVEQVVVAREVGAVVADVAEKGAEQAVVVERNRKRAGA